MRILNLLKKILEFCKIVKPVYAMPRTVDEDPIQKFMYRVRIPGYPAGLGFTKISSFKKEMNIVEYAEGMYEYFHKLAGRQKVTDITFERGAYRDYHMANLYFNTLRDPKHRTTVTIEILDRYGGTAREYILAEAWAASLETDGVDASSDDVVIDKMTIAFEYFLSDETALQMRGIN